MITIHPGCSVLWRDHPGVYVVLDRSRLVMLVRERGNPDAQSEWAARSQLTRVSEDVAVARLIEAARQKCQTIT